MYFTESDDSQIEIGGIRFWAREDDVSVVREVVDGDCYGLKSSPVEDPGVVIDVGGHIGSFSLLAMRTWPGAKVVCYEPSPLNFEILAKNVRGTGVHAIQAAVTGTVRTPVQYVEQSAVSKWNEDNSTADGFVVSSEVPNSGLAGTSKPIDVPSVSIIDIIGNEERIGFLKLDCECSEVPIMEALREHMDRVGVVRGEYHGYGSLERIFQAVRRTHEVYSSPIFDDLGYFSCEPRS